MMRSLALVVVLLGVSVETARAEPDEYSGLCDASAAVSLGGGRFVVAEDENLNKLFTYRMDESEPQSTLDLLDYLGNENDDDPRESDLEAAAQIGNQVYWISSHGTDKDGVPEENRFRLFATALAGESASLTVEMPAKPPVKTLRDAFPRRPAPDLPRPR